MVRRRVSAIAIVLLSGALLASAQGWIDYENREDRFSVNFPAQPKVESIDWPGEYGPMFPGRVYAVEAGGARYSVTVIDYTSTRAIHAKLQKNQADELPIYADLDPVGSIQYAATKLYRKRPGAMVTYDAYHYIDLVSGQQLQLTNADGSRTFVGIYLHEGRLYILDATVPPKAPQPGLFQQSLSFLDEKGERVRHNEIYYYRPAPRPGRRDGGAGPGGRQ
jgi:hypothetical protein